MHFIIGEIKTQAGIIPIVSTVLNWKDMIGAIRVRWGIRRNNYKINPGLYAIGSPNEGSEVLVTANYKLTFDTVRKNLSGMNVWLLVLNTHGVNVWCAAGKGTFSSEELIYRTHKVHLEKVVNHRRLILPQLGAPGISAHKVKNWGVDKTRYINTDTIKSNTPNTKFVYSEANLLQGYRVVYGPVKASDIKKFFELKFKATPEMRRVKFGIADRLKLIPNDFLYGKKYLTGIILSLIVFSLIGKPYPFDWSIIKSQSIQIAVIISTAYVSGIVLTPILLPFIPVKMFALKGLIISLITSFILIGFGLIGPGITYQLSFILLNGSLASFVAMNFTGSSTYTSLSGVKTEMKFAIPLQVTMGVMGLILFIVGNILNFNKL